MLSLKHLHSSSPLLVERPSAAAALGLTLGSRCRRRSGRRGLLEVEVELRLLPNAPARVLKYNKRETIRAGSSP